MSFFAWSTGKDKCEANEIVLRNGPKTKNPGPKPGAE